MSLSTTFLKASEFLSLNACQADFSLASIAALSGVAAMETAMVAKKATIVRVICFFIMSFRWGWVLKSACCIQAHGQWRAMPRPNSHGIILIRADCVEFRAHGTMGADSRDDCRAGD